MAIEQQNGDYNLTTAVSIYNKTATADGQWLLDIRAGDGTKDLNTAVGTLTLAVTIGGATLNGGAVSVAKDAAVLRAVMFTPQIFVANGDAVTVTLLSTSASDTDVDVTVTPRLLWTNVETIKAQALVCGATVTILASVGTAATSTTQTGDVANLLLALVPTTAAVNDAAASTTVFVTTLASSVNDFYKGQAVVFTSGALAGQLGQIKSYVGSSKTVTLQSALTSAPVNAVTFSIVNVAASRKFADLLGTAMGADNKMLLSTDAQDLSATLSVNTKKLGGVAFDDTVAVGSLPTLRLKHFEINGRNRD